MLAPRSELGEWKRFYAVCAGVRLDAHKRRIVGAVDRVVVWALCTTDVDDERERWRMFDPKAEPCERARLLAKSVARWDAEGGAGEGGREYPVSGALLAHADADALPLSNAAFSHRPDFRIDCMHINDAAP